MTRCFRGGLLAGAILAAVGGTGFWSSAAAEEKQPRSLAQIQGLIENEIPDEVVAGEIAANGVDFNVTPETLKVLKVKGAGPQTLDQLNRRVARPRLVVVAGVPSARILLDGKPLGETGPEGRAEFRDVKPGRREILVVAAGYEDFRQIVEVQRGRDGRVEARLQPSLVRVTLRTDRDEARLDLAGCRPAEGKNEFACLPPGVFRASGESPGALPWQAEVEVAVGEGARTLAVDFRVDPAWREARIEAGWKAWSGRDAEGLAREAQELARWDPQDSEGLSLAAQAAFLNDDAPLFLRLAGAALRGGAKVTLPLVRLSAEEKERPTWLGKLLASGKGPPTLLPVEVILSAGELTFILASGAGSTGMPAAETRTALPRASLEGAALTADGAWIELTGRLPDSPRVWTLARLTDRRSALKETPRKFLQAKARVAAEPPEAGRKTLEAIRDLFLTLP